MKMRDELELYRTKTIELEDVLRAATEAHATTLNEQQRKTDNEMLELTAASEKKFKDKDDQYQRRQADVTRLQEQINNLQDILDVIPGVMSRKKEDNYTENACHVRLASVLAVKFM